MYFCKSVLYMEERHFTSTQEYVTERSRHYPSISTIQKCTRKESKCECRAKFSVLIGNELHHKTSNTFDGNYHNNNEGLGWKYVQRSFFFCF